MSTINTVATSLTASVAANTTFTETRGSVMKIWCQPEKGVNVFITLGQDGLVIAKMDGSQAVAFRNDDLIALAGTLNTSLLTSTVTTTSTADTTVLSAAAAKT